MVDDNPFVAPQEPLRAQLNEGELEFEGKLKGMDPKAVRKLYLRSCNVNAIAILMLLGATIFLIVGGVALSGRINTSDNVLVGFFPILGILYLIGGIFVVVRKGPARTIGIIACCLMLINIPLGTIIGAFGLFAFIGGTALFGPNRITHRELKAANKRLKAMKA